MFDLAVRSVTIDKWRWWSTFGNMFCKQAFFLQGSDHLTVTWKVDEGIYQHIDIKEQGKENAFSLGKSLWIENEVRKEEFLMNASLFNALGVF